MASSHIDASDAINPTPPEEEQMPGPAAAAGTTRRLDLVSEKPLKGRNTKEAPALQIIRSFDPYHYLKVDGIDHYRHNCGELKDEIISGLTIAVLQVPESVAFSFVAGVDPIVGLHSTFLLGFITAAIGGKPAMISGAAGAMAVVIKDLTDPDGPLSALTEEERFQHLLMSVVFTGVFQMVCGFLQLAKLMKLLPYPSTLGFLNGLGIVIFMSQFRTFQKCLEDVPFEDCDEGDIKYMRIDNHRTWLTMLLAFITMCFMILLPRYITSVSDSRPGLAKGLRILPPSMIAIVVGTAWEWGLHRAAFGTSTRTVGETAGIDGEPPVFNWPDLGDNADWATVMIYAIQLCFVGLIESVLTLEAVDVITETMPSSFRSNQECVAQGFGNFICGIFNAMGGDAMIGQSTINVLNGARGRISGMVAGLMMLIFVVALSPVIELVPVGTLTGLIFMVVLNTFNFNTFYILTKVPIGDAIAICLVTAISVWQNLAIGVAVGVFFMAVVDVSSRSSSFAAPPRMEIYTDNKERKVYVPKEPLFFGAVRNFVNSFEPATDPRIVIVDFSESEVVDYSGFNAINDTYQRYRGKKKYFYLQNLSERSRAVLKKADGLCEAPIIEPGAQLPLEGEPDLRSASEREKAASNGGTQPQGLTPTPDGTEPDDERKAAEERI